MSTVLSAAREMIPVARPCLGEEEERGVLDVLRSGWVTQGPRVAEFERRFAVGWSERAGILGGRR